MVFCNNCRKGLEDSDIFCPYCGSSKDARVEQTRLHNNPNSTDIVYHEDNTTNNEILKKDIQIIISTSHPDLSIISASNYFNQNTFVIVGEVLNKGRKEIPFVQVIGTYYNDSRKVIGTSGTYTNPPAIPPSETVPFKLIVYPDDIVSFDFFKSYKLIVSSS